MHPKQCDCVVHVSWTTALGSLPDRARYSDRTVLRALAEDRRLSIFDACGRAGIARAVERVVKRGLAAIEPQGFPWSRVEITEAGRKVLRG